MGPEWIAKSNMQSFLKQKDQQQDPVNSTGQLKVSQYYMHTRTRYARDTAYFCIILKCRFQIHYNQEVVAISSDGGASWAPTADAPTLQPSVDQHTDAALALDPQGQVYPIYLRTTEGQVRFYPAFIIVV